MLGLLGTRLLGHLVTVEFALPRAVLDGPLAAEATPAWSWRMMRGMAPGADGRAAIAGLRGPVLVLAGEADEAFDPAGYRAAFAGTPGSVEVLPGLGHAGLLLDGAVAARILALAGGLSPGGPPSPAPPPIPRA